MERNRKMNRCAIAAFTIMYIVGVICLFMFHPIVASAAEQVPGGVGNVVTVDSYSEYTESNRAIRESATMKAASDYEIVAHLNTSYVNKDDPLYYTIQFYQFNPSTGDIRSLRASGVSDYVGVRMEYRKGELYSSLYYNTSNMINSFTYANISQENTIITCTVTGCKIFMDRDAMYAYAESGSLDGMINEDDVDSGMYDSNIGYLHDLKWLPAMYGELDENGFYENFDDRFTWSDYYPEYDDSYLVEVRASCEVEVKKWFGIGKSTVYNSDIRQLATGVKYKDLEYIVSLADQNSLFADFMNEYMPGNDSLSDVISSATYRFDTYYFRIYRWDEETESYKYGLWVRLTKDGSALLASLEFTTDAGDLDDNGKWKQNSDSDYGTGKRGSATPGSGETLEDAKAEADRKQEEKDNGGKPLDLSNTNFQELWEWFTGSLYTLFSGLGVIPDFFGRLFSFLPSPVIGFLAVGIVVAIILRVLGR